MVSTETKCGYQWNDAQLDAHSALLLNPLLSMLSSIPRMDGSKLTVLDLGCGNGSLSAEIARHGYEVTGVEDSPSGIVLARQAYPDCEFIEANVYTLPQQLLQNSFDVVISVEVIEHLFFPSRLLKSAKQCLKPGGRLILTTPYHGYLKNIALAVAGKMDKHTLYEGGHIKFFSVKTLTQLLESEGYGDLEYQFAGRLPYLWKSMLCSAKPM